MIRLSALALGCVVLLAATEGCGGAAELTSSRVIRSGWEQRLSRAPERDVALIDVTATRDGARFQVERGEGCSVWHRWVEVREDTYHRKSSPERNTALAVAFLLSGAVTTTSVYNVANSESCASSGCALSTLGIMAGVSGLIATGVILTVDAARASDFVEENEVASPPQESDGTPCRRVPVANVRTDLVLASGERVTAATDESGEASVAIAKQAWSADGTIEADVYVGGRFVRRVTLARPSPALPGEH